MTTLIVGGGWSGLAAAIELSQRGEKIILLDSAKQLGGRARNTHWNNAIVDNGQHLLIGAYKQTLNLFRQMGYQPELFFKRLPLDLTIHDPHYPALRLRRSGILPWPLSLAGNLLRDNGFAIAQQILRLGLHARSQRTCLDQSVINWLKQNRQSDRLVKQLWEPLCLATLNTPIEQASAQVFADVLMTVFQCADHSDLLIPNQPLGETLPATAAEYLVSKKQQIQLQTRVTSLQIQNQKIVGVETADGDIIAADQVIIACNPENATRLLDNQLSPPALHSFPITTVYLQYASTVSLQQSVIGLSQQISQWVFDRTAQTPGLIAIVISGQGPHEAMTRQQLSQHVAEEIRPWLTHPDVNPETCLVIRERRATFACNVDIQQHRPNSHTNISGLWLAGDIVKNPYPATLEGAVINGIHAANRVIEHRSPSR